jgi:hypothetical protein
MASQRLTDMPAEEQRELKKALKEAIEALLPPGRAGGKCPYLMVLCDYPAPDADPFTPYTWTLIGNVVDETGLAILEEAHARLKQLLSMQAMQAADKNEPETPPSEPSTTSS